MDDGRKTSDDLPDRKHLHRLTKVFDNYQPAIFFVTICTRERRKVLVFPEVAFEIAGVFDKCEELYGWEIGKYVIMPDHIHFFCRSIGGEKKLSDLVRDIKKWVARKARSAGFPGDLWQDEFFDHLLRGYESYSSKWEYVRNNPVRAGLCKNPDDWPWQGECAVISMR